MFSSVSDNPIVALIIVVAIFVFLFALLREFMCWYWKINRIVDLLADIKSYAEPSDTFTCPNCRRQTNINGNFCQSCGKSLPSG